MQRPIGGAFAAENLLDRRRELDRLPQGVRDPLAGRGVLELAGVAHQHPARAGEYRKKPSLDITRTGPTRFAPASAASSSGQRANSVAWMASRSPSTSSLRSSEGTTAAMNRSESVGKARNPWSPILPSHRWSSSVAAPSKYAQAKSLPAGVWWYFAAPTRRATADLTPSAPTTSGARSSPDLVFTPATRPRSSTRPVTAVWVRTSAPAAAAPRGGARQRDPPRAQHRRPDQLCEVIELDSGATKGDRPPGDRRADLEERFEHSKVVEDRDARGLHGMGGGRIARKPRAVENAHLQSNASEEGGQR